MEKKINVVDNSVAMSTKKTREIKIINEDEKMHEEINEKCVLI